MKKHVLEIIACPECKGDLQLKISEEENEEVITGEFHCPNCYKSYPIQEGIPNMLPPAPSKSAP
jgi:uncharacterized protein YbaR (Trm112 family)